MRFAFYGRVSTEDQQDPVASRNWQLSRAQALVDPHGEIVHEYFDVGHSRSIPWKRRPEASRLLGDIRDRSRGIDAVVVGEPHRAFYGNQYGLTFPVLVHYGVQLWVPEVGGAIDPDSEAHELIMSVFGGMSKGERNRIKIRVRSAMAAQARVEGRFLGGRPPYGYRLADGGPHPNPAKAADGRRLHVLEPDPVTAPVVRRIFAEYLAGIGLFTIAEGLTKDGVLSPSAQDRARNRHRSTTAWSKGAVRVILSNPRYTGRQVWNKQRKDEVLIDVEDVALGHESRMRWNQRAAWVWSTEVVHAPLVDAAVFAQAQEIIAGRGMSRRTRARERVRRPYVLRGLVHCGVCLRKMQGQWTRDQAYYRCRYPREYALANTIEHPPNVYLLESAVMPALDGWLAGLFEPEALPQTVGALYRAQPATTASDAGAEEAARVVAECDTKLERYRAALEAGTDPVMIASWTAEVQARKAQALATTRLESGTKRLTEREIETVVAALGSIRSVLEHASANDKAAVYRQLNLKLIYKPDNALVNAEVDIDPKTWGYGSCPRGDLNPHALLGH